MSIISDIERGEKVVKSLFTSYYLTEGIHGVKMTPEDVAPAGIVLGSIDHILFVTLTVSIDYQRDASTLWESARKTFEDPETRYLFVPKLLHETSFKKIIADMQKYKLSKKPRKDAKIWKTVGVTFYKKWDGDPRKFLENCNWDALVILERLREDFHIHNGKRIPDFPYLRGRKIAPLWLRMLRDNVGINRFKNLHKVPIPVDIHVARATLATGIIRGRFECKVSEIFEEIRKVWFEVVKRVKVDDKEIVAIDMDKPLWTLSRYGCTNRDIKTGECPLYDNCVVKEFCIKGAIELDIKRGVVRVDT